MKVNPEARISTSNLLASCRSWAGMLLSAGACKSAGNFLTSAAEVATAQVWGPSHKFTDIADDIRSAFASIA